MMSRTTSQRMVECCCHSPLQVVLECLKAELSNKPEICFANFSVHAQEFSEYKRSALHHQSETWWKIPDILKDNIFRLDILE